MGGKRTVTREEKLEKIRVNRIMSKGPVDVPLVLLVLLLTGIGVLIVIFTAVSKRRPQKYTYQSPQSL